MRLFRFRLNALVSLLFGLQSWAAPSSPISVFTEKAAPQSIFNILTYPARVESRVNAVVRSESDGVITKINKPLGSSVRRGEIIAVIKHTDPVFQYAPLNLVAPVTGVVSEVQVTLGSLVNKGDNVVTVTDPRNLRIVIEVAAQDLAVVKSGLNGEMAIGGFPQPIPAQVQGVSPSIDPMLGTATCEMKISSTDQKRIFPGMLGEVQFKTNQRQGFLLPDYAVVYRGENTFVRVVTNGVAKKVPVKLGEKRQGQVEIVSGVNPGDQIIDRASRFVGDGDAVQVETAHE